MMLAAAVIVFGVAAALCASAVPPPFVKPTLVPGPQSAEYRLDSPDIAVLVFKGLIGAVGRYAPLVTVFMIVALQ